MVSCLRLAVLRRLNRSPHAGYGLMKGIYEDTGWKPSPGSVYPLLKKLEKEGLVNLKREGRRKVYHLTKDGKKELTTLEDETDDDIPRLIGRLQVCAGSDADEILERLEDDDNVFNYLRKELSDMHKLLFSLATNKLTDSQKKDLELSAKDLHKKLRKYSK